MKKITQHLRLILIGVGGVATISVNPNTRSTGAATITINPARHTSKTNVIGRVGEKFGPKICHLHRNTYGKGKLVRSWNPLADLKYIAIGI